MLLMLIASLFLHTGDAAVYAATKDDVRRTVSANEKMITRFRKEIDMASDAHKRDGLLVKIENLEEQNRVLKGGPTPPATVAEPVPVKRSKELEDLTGDDWSRLSESERQRFIYTAIGGLERQGIFVTRAPHEYQEAIEKMLQSEPSLKREYLDNLLVFCVYDGEPQTREGIRRIRDEARASQGA